MQRKVQLKQKTSLKAKAGLKPKKSIAAAKPKGVAKLKKEADDLFSAYVVYRDGQLRADGWYSQCITCDKWVKLVYKKDGTVDRRPIHWGHFQSSRHNITRYDEENVNAQCQACNIHNQGEQYKYSLALDLKYGAGTATKLHQKAKQLHPFKREELEAIIEETRQQLDFYLNKT